MLQGLRVRPRLEEARNQSPLNCWALNYIFYLAPAQLYNQDSAELYSPQTTFRRDLQLPGSEVDAVGTARSTKTK